MIYKEMIRMIFLQSTSNDRFDIELWYAIDISR